MTKSKETKPKAPKTGKTDTVELNGHEYNAKDHALMQKATSTLKDLHATFDGTPVELVSAVLLPSVDDSVTHSRLVVYATNRSVDHVIRNLRKETKAGLGDGEFDELLALLGNL